MPKDNRLEGGWVEVEEVRFSGSTEHLFMTLFCENKNCFWLDSNRENQEKEARYSFMGSFESALDKIVFSYQPNEVEVVSLKGKKIIKQSIFDYLKHSLIESNQLTFKGVELPFGFKTGYVGYLGYELKEDLGFPCSHRSETPNAALFFSSRTVVYDHTKNNLYLLSITTPETKKETKDWFEEIASKLKEDKEVRKPYVESRPGKISFELSQNREEYLQNIHRCKEQIIDGESYEICLTNRIQTDFSLDPLNLYRFLLRNNPAPYSAFLKFDGFSILSSSPEQFLKIDKEGWISTKPIKGTITKNEDPVIDLQGKYHLEHNQKDRAENLMIVDLLRNDLGKVCEIGSVSVPVLMQVESYATLHQLVSTIKGKLRSELSVLDCIEATFPGGSITGAPKIRTMEIIDQLESDARGVYTGSIGYISIDNHVDLNIAIRTATVTDDKITIGVGGAITFLSDPDEEFDEILVKGFPLIKTIVTACKGRFSKDDYRFSNCEIC